MLKVQFWKLLLFVLGTILDATQAYRCVNDHMPVCARYGREYLLFANKCDLMVAKREQLLGILNEVPLRFCVVSCEFSCKLQDEEPICGLNTITGEQKTFHNRCELAQMSCLSNSHWKLHHSGICSTVSQPSSKKLTSPKTKRQPLPCTGVYRPVCATYAAVKSTFDNECFVNAENINTGKSWQVISHGICAEDQNSESYQKWQASVQQKNKLLKTSVKAKVMDRTKRSAASKSSEFNDFDLGENTVYIYAPNAFETQFINSNGNIEKSYQSEISSQVEPNYNYMKMSQPKMLEPCIYGSESVCGTFNKETRNFTDLCALMDHSQRTGNDWNILHEGLCRKCKHDCGARYEPLCVNRSGLNYTLFNECYLRRMKCMDPKTIWNVVRVGECLASPHEELKNKYMTKPPGFYFTSHYAGEDASNGGELSVSQDVTTVKSPKYFSTPQLTTTSSTTWKPSTTTKSIVPTTTISNIPTATESIAYIETKTPSPRTTISTEATTTTTTSTTKPVKWYHFIKNEAETLSWKNSGRASIYGPESNSLIMRLARAKMRSNN